MRPVMLQWGGGVSLSSLTPTTPQGRVVQLDAKGSSRKVMPLPVQAWAMPTKPWQKAPYVFAAPQHGSRTNLLPGGGEGEAVEADGGSVAVWLMPQGHTDTGLKHARAKAPAGGDGGLRRIATLAQRVERLPPDALRRIKVIHGRVQDVKPIPGAFVLFDPPYLGAPRYAAVFPREEVLDAARAWAKVAARVVVCEGEPLPLDGWSTWRLAAKEWVTAWGVSHAPNAQLNLLPAVYRSDRKPCRL